MKILITGICGFAGKHLTEYLFSIGQSEITGIDSADKWPYNTPVDSTPDFYQCDLTSSDIAGILNQVKPDGIIHLAGLAQVEGSEERAAAIKSVNVGGTQRLMDAIHETVPDARVVIISSSEVYGDAPTPTDEKAALAPGNPYSESKVAAENIALQHYHDFQQPVMIARPFNHIGPGQHGNFVVPIVVNQLVRIKAGEQAPEVEMGNTNTYRDFTDVRDIVRAYWLILSEGKPGEVYNICSGNIWQIEEITRKLIDYSETGASITHPSRLKREHDVLKVQGDCRKLRELGDWKPEVPIEQSLADALDQALKENVGNSTSRS